jgi:hypothetical protein
LLSVEPFVDRPKLGLSARVVERLQRSVPTTLDYILPQRLPDHIAILERWQRPSSFSDPRFINWRVWKSCCLRCAAEHLGALSPEFADRFAVGLPLFGERHAPS